MIKLIKKHGFGGFAELIDRSLDGLGTWGKLGVQILDPTGITGWKDLGESLKAFLKEGTILKAGELGLSTLGAIPMIGVFKSFPKILGLAKNANNIESSAKLVKKVQDLPKSINLETYKKLLDPKINIKGVLDNLDIEDLTKLLECIQTSASQYIKSIGKSSASPELVAKTKRYEDLLSYLDKEILDRQIQAMYIEGDDILATSSHLFNVDNTGKVVKGGPDRKLTKKTDKEKADNLKRNRDAYILLNQEIYFKD